MIKHLLMFCTGYYRHFDGKAEVKEFLNPSKSHCNTQGWAACLITFEFDLKTDTQMKALIFSSDEWAMFFVCAQNTGTKIPTYYSNINSEDCLGFVLDPKHDENV